jgi:hypothetical protein
MQFSPKIRTVLTALVAALAVVAVALPSLGAPLWVGIIIGAVVAGLGAIGIVPPQTGGTQEGGFKAQLSSPPTVETPGPGDGVVREQPVIAEDPEFVGRILPDPAQGELWRSKTERHNYDAPRKRGFEGDV